jgi:hypothetical protein
MYIEMYKEYLIPQLSKEQLIVQKKSFEKTMRFGNHPTAIEIHKLICEQINKL